MAHHFTSSSAGFQLNTFSLGSAAWPIRKKYRRDDAGGTLAMATQFHDAMLTADIFARSSVYTISIRYKVLPGIISPVEYSSKISHDSGNVPTALLSRLSTITRFWPGSRHQLTDTGYRHFTTITPLFSSRRRTIRDDTLHLSSATPQHNEKLSL